MVEARDTVRIQLEYGGSDAVNRLGADLDKAKQSIQGMLSGLGSTAGTDRRLKENAGKAVRILNEEVDRALKSSVHHGGQADLSRGFGERFALAAGIPARNKRQFAEMAQAAETYARRVIAAATSTTNAFGLPRSRVIDPTAAMRQGLVQTDIATGRLSRSVAELQSRQAALARVPTPLQSEVRTLERANVSAATKDVLARSSAANLAAPTAGVAAPVVAPRYPEAFERARAATTPVRDPARAIVEALTRGPTQQEKDSGWNWPKRRFDEVAQQFGMTSAQLRTFQRDNAALISTVREETRVRSEAIRANLKTPGAFVGDFPAAKRGSLALDDFAKMLPRSPSTALNTQAGLATRQRAMLGEYEANFRATAERERRERTARMQIEQAQSTGARLGISSAVDTSLGELLKGQRFDQVRLGSLAAAREQQKYNYGDYRGNIQAAKDNEAAAARAARNEEQQAKANQRDQEKRRKEQEGRRKEQERQDAQKARDDARQARVDQRFAYGSYAPNLDATQRMGGRVRGTFREEFKDAFTGAGRAGGVGEMMGQAARISLTYGVMYRALSLVQQGLQQAVQETLAYETALTNLNIVTQRTREQNSALANSLEGSAAVAGFAPSVGLELGSRAVGLYGVAQASQREQERTITTATEVATRMARVSGADPVQVQTQLAGAMRSLGWGPGRLTEMEDTISYISRQTGQAPTELLGAVSNIATLGTQAGFTPQQLAALVAQVGTTTGQNPEATAGQFRQLLSRSASDIAASAGQIIGEDLRGLNLQEIFATVSEREISAGQLNQFASLFGKGGSQQVATILTQQYGTVQSLATEAADSPGFGRDAFNRAMDSIQGKLSEFSGAMSDFGVTLVQTGLLDWMAALVMGTTAVLRAGTELLDFFNELPRPLRSVAMVLGEIYLASMLISKFSGGRLTLGTLLAGSSGVAGFGASRVGAGAAGIAAAQNSSQALARLANTATHNAKLATLGGLQNASLAGVSAAANANRAAAAAGSAGAMGFVRTFREINQASSWSSIFTRTDQQMLDRRRQGINDTSNIRGGRVALAGLAVAGLVGATVKSAYDTAQESEAAVSQARLAIAAADSAEALREAASAARDQAQALRENTLDELAVGDVANLLPAIIGSVFGGAGAARELEQRAQKAQDRADAIDAAKQAAIDADSSRVFQDFTLAGLQGTMAALDERGYTAAESMDLLNEAMARFISGAGAPGVAASIQEWDREGISAGLGNAALNAIEAGRRGVETERDKYAMTGGLFNMGRGYGPGNPFNKAFDAMKYISDEDETVIREALNYQMGNLLRTVPDSGEVSPQKLEYLKKQAYADAERAIPDKAWAAIEDTGQTELIEGLLRRQVDALFDAFTITPQRENIAARAQVSRARYGLERDATARLAGGSEGANQQYLANLVSERDTLRAGIAQSGVEATEEENRQIRELERDIVVARQAVMADVLARAKATTDLAIAGLHGGAVGARTSLELQGIGNQLGLLAEQRTQLAGDASLSEDERAAALLQNELATMGVETQRAATRERARQEGVTRRIAAVGVGRDPRDDIGRAQDAVTQAGIRLRGSVRGEAEYYEALKAHREAQQQLANAVVSRDNAADTASIAGSRSQIAQAEVGLRVAQRTLSSTLAGTEAYYSALGAVQEAQAALSAAYLAQNDRVRRLSSDLTNPVEQARLDIERAREQLQYDISSGQGADVIAQSQLDLRSAENQQEAAAFNQRISDLQTAEDLGRISHAAYMSYLQSEHDRLTAIGNRTRQQQEQLDQVDKLMKSAAEQLQGQFNIGDIDLPSVYEVRRAMQSGASTQVADYSNSNNVVNVNGADFGAVVQWLTQYLGAGAQVVTAPSPRRI